MPIGEPLTGLTFVLEVGGVQMAMFQACSGVGSTSDVVENRTVGPDGKEVIRKLPGKLKWPNLVLERGLEPSDKLWAWRQQVVDGKVADARKNGAVSVMGPDGSRLLRWEFINGWPCGWLVSTEDGSKMTLEQLEIAHEGLRLVR